MTAATDRKADDKPKYRVVGTRPLRHDGYNKVTGRAKYGADIQLPGMLDGAHPSYVEGQMQGGSVQGIGWALNEGYFYNDSGLMVNSSFLDDRMPTALDLPMIDTVMVEVPNAGHPFGVRGVGEVAIIPPLAAVANAIYASTGVRMASLPMSPGAVRDAIAAKARGR